MILKVIAGLILMVAAYCQDHQGHSYRLRTVVRHEVPKKTEHYQHHEVQYKAVPVQKHFVPVKSSHARENKIVQNDISKKIFFTPKEPAPVYESHAPVRADVQLKVVEKTVPHAPTQHHVLQVVQQTPIKPQAIKVSPIIPVLHQASIAPIIQHATVAPVIKFTPIHYPAVQVSHKIPVQKYSAKVSHHKPIHHDIVELAHAPVHHDVEYPTETSHKESHNHHKESQKEHEDHHIDYYAYPKYEFEYEVKDPHTHDEKYQHESRDGDTVEGVYSLHEPNGSIRTVKYSSHKKTGFTAEVSHKGYTEHVIPHHSH